MSEVVPQVVAMVSSTLSGATTMKVNPWMTAAVVVAYATRAIWVKMRTAASKQELLKTCQDDASLEKEEDESDSEAEAEDEVEVAASKHELVKSIQYDAGRIARSIEV